MNKKYYSYDLDYGYETHVSAEDARKCAEDAIDLERDHAGDGWCPEVSDIEWGYLVPLGEARECDVYHPGNGNEEKDLLAVARDCSYLCDYRLHSIEDPSVALAAENEQLRARLAVAERRTEQLRGALSQALDAMQYSDDPREIIAACARAEPALADHKAMKSSLVALPPPPCASAESDWATNREEEFI